MINKIENFDLFGVKLPCEGNDGSVAQTAEYVLILVTFACLAVNS